MPEPAAHRPWYQYDLSEILLHWETSTQGLTESEVRQRRERYGSNQIPQPKSKGMLEIFFHQFLSPLIYVLLAAAVISFVIGEWHDGIFILAIIVINAILGTYQEWRAENSAAALRNLVRVQSRVRREGRIIPVDSEDLVPGDIVLLDSGMKVPGDLRLIDVQELLMEEALLTGESLAVHKQTEPIAADHASPGDQVNMAFAGTSVQKGRGTGVVVATARHTELGKIADTLKSTAEERPPLIQRMESFSRKISIGVVVACLLLGVIGFMRGMPLVEIFFFMIAVGVSAIPEGLPVALTVALSIGTRRMARRHVIIRKLPAVEGLGSCTFIASDKTGTLTMDQQSVRQLILPNGEAYTITGEGYHGEGNILDVQQRPVGDLNDILFALLQACILSNEAVLRKTEQGWQYSGDAVDVAFRALAYKAGKHPSFFQEGVEVESLVPYESENKFSGIFYRYKGERWFAMKGAVEVVSERLSETGRQLSFDESEKMAADGFRVIAFAGGVVNSSSLDNLPELDLLGLAGLIDPLRPESLPAIRECRDAGIEVAMITGDHPATAYSIAQNLGIAVRKEQVATGLDLHYWWQEGAESFREKIRDKTVFARVTPLQKKQIVEAQKEAGHFIAVTGDGANDAPALKTAHIGVAMGDGTDLAKEASSIIITDNNFASIAAGVEEGRFTYDNLRKIIYLLISTGFAEILTVALALILNTPLPFLAVQLLWLNLVTNGIQDISLAFEKGDPAVMKKPPRKPDESIFDPLMNRQLIISGIIMAILAFGLWYYLTAVQKTPETHARTMVMMLMVLMQNFHVFNCRSEIQSAFSIPLHHNWTLVIGTLLAQAVHILASYIPFLASTLKLEPIHFREWLMLLPIASLILIIMEIFKWYWRKTHREYGGRAS